MPYTNQQRKAREEALRKQGRCLAHPDAEASPGHVRCSKCLERSRERTRRNNEALKRRVIEAYGGRCQCPGCDECRMPFLTIDHVDGGGLAHRKEIGASQLYRWLEKNGYPKDGFRLLCYNCNCARRNGPCPVHEAQR